MIFRIFLTSIIIFFSFSAFSANIRVLDFQKIIDNNATISLLYEQISKDQQPHRQKFKNEELNLQKELERIEKLKLILETSEFQKEINNYNIQLNNFNDQIEKFNLHYDLQIKNHKNKIIDKILEVLRKYSEDNQIDLVLDSKNYILSSNSINITDLIEEQVNKKKIEINFEKY